MGTTEVQELAVLRLEFDSPVPLKAGCVIEIVFPDDFELTSTDLQYVDGLNLFEAKRKMDGILDTGLNSYTMGIGDACRID